MVKLILDGIEYECQTDEEASLLRNKHRIYDLRNRILKLELENHMIQRGIHQNGKKVGSHDGFPF